MGNALRGLIVLTLALAVAGCGGFDPGEQRPCDFVPNKELKEYQLHRAVNQDDRCVWNKPSGSEDTLDGMEIVYLDEKPGAVAQRMGLQPVTLVPADDTRIEFQGSKMDNGPDGKPDPSRGHCWLVVPRGDDRTMLLDLAIDTSWVRFYVERVTEPCAYIAYDKFHLGKLLEKLE
ncbi:hypothetical protein [Actinoplanes sp. NPDC049265]|uniref:hypothetical protein n=1 Tax=Actinoplanes sp. NPDC049265 TaxID=3363902 RepID=UPI00371BDA21